MSIPSKNSVLPLDILEVQVEQSNFDIGKEDNLGSIIFEILPAARPGFEPGTSRLDI